MPILSAFVAALFVAGAAACGPSTKPAVDTPDVVQPQGRVVSAVRRAGGWSIATEALDGGRTRLVSLGSVRPRSAISLSPSGRRGAFVGTDGGRRGVYLVNFDARTIRFFPTGSDIGTLDLVGGSMRTFLALEWSPDERRLAFLSQDGRPTRANRLPKCLPQRAGDFAVHVLDLDRGAVRALPALPPAAAPLARTPTWIEGLSWAPDGRRILYAVWQGSDCSTEGEDLREVQLTIVSATGAEPVPVARARWPGPTSWSPDGTRFALAGTLWGPSEWPVVVDVARRRSERLPSDYAGVAWTRLGIYGLRRSDSATRSAIVLIDPVQGVERVVAPVAHEDPSNEIVAPLDGRCVAFVSPRDPDAAELRWRLRVYSVRGRLLLDRDISHADDFTLSCRRAALPTTATRYVSKRSW